jgi:periplasmic divalent cation tolerance protein
VSSDSQNSSAEKSSPDCVILYCTASSRDEALMISRVLVADTLAACANILGPITSVYRWQEDICESEEISFIIKTSKKKSDQAIARITQIHSYECPCVIAFSVETGYPPFLSWINNMLSE